MSLNTTYSADNVFAKIIRGELPSVKIFEDDDVLAFMDVFPQNDGHCLVIHKRATATNLLDMDPADLAIVTAAVQKLARAVVKGLEPDGVRIAQFNGSDAGQTVFHLHFHIIPAYKDVPLRGHGAGEPADTNKLEALAERIRGAL